MGVKRNISGYIVEVSEEDAHLFDRSGWYVFLGGRAKNRPYVHRSVGGGRKEMLHRVIMNAPKGVMVDHVDGNTLDCRRPNLRLATRSENGMNRGKTRLNRSGYKGVSWHKHKQKWRACIKVGQRKHELGYFDCKIKAYEAYCKAAVELHGDFVNLG